MKQKKKKMSTENKEWSINSTTVNKSLVVGDFFVEVETKIVGSEKVSVKIMTRFNEGSKRIESAPDWLGSNLLYAGSYTKHAQYSYDTPEQCSVSFNKEVITKEEVVQLTEMLYSECE